ncbi:MAG TPA: hypothetical protein VD969_03055 [Symbiobacteriaceae bacterium]|nr:hypothetical protein [Symbiobacteriaceae bacterium]
MSSPLIQHALRLEIGFQAHPEMEVPVAVYAFSPHGKLLATAPVKNGIAELPLPPERARTARILVAPPLEAAMVPTLPKITRMNPYKPLWDFRDGQAEYRLLPIPEVYCRAWAPVATRVRGQVVKAVEYHGTVVDVPVPRTRVVVYEVDAVIRFIMGLEDAPVFRVRDELLRLIEQRAHGLQIPTDPQIVRALPVHALRDWMIGLYQAWPRRWELIHVLRPWIRYTLEEQARIPTDQNGRFDVSFHTWPYLSSPDGPLGPWPDLYFKVEYQLGGEWTVVYAPPVGEATHWEYRGQEVILRITDPRVEVFPPAEYLTGNEVGILTIGNYVNISDIVDGLAPGGAPFAGRLEPHVFFGEELAEAHAYYRWSYHKVGSADPWQVINTPVVRHYIQQLANGDVIVGQDAMGPVALAGVGEVFRVQPLTPPAGTWAPQVDARANTATAIWKTPILNGNSELAFGRYELKLELFDAGGHPLPVTFRVPRAGQPIEQANLDPAPEGQVTTDPAGGGLAFTMQLQVDNRHCVAQIRDVAVPGHLLDSCGFITFTHPEAPDAQVSFRAYHPDGCATFAFDLVKGKTAIDKVGGKVDEPAIAQHQVVDPVHGADAAGETTMPDHTYTRQPHGAFAASIPALQMMAPCTRAAFAEYLYVRAMATDGWYRQSQYDAAAGPVGFAIEQMLPPTP